MDGIGKLIVAGLAILFGTAVVVIIAGAALTWTTVSQWFTANKNVDSDHGELIKKMLANGKYSVTAGVFNRSRAETAQQVWQADDIDSDLRDRFGSSDKIRVTL